MRILLISQQESFRQRCRDLLHAAFHHDHVLESASSNAAVSAHGTTDPQPRHLQLRLILLDADAGHAVSAGQLRSLRRRFPAALLTLISNETVPDTLLEAVKAGASAIIPRDCPDDEFRAALGLLARGISYLPACVLRHLADGTQHTALELAAESDITLTGLSHRQREVLDEALRGKPNKQIARDLGVSEATIKAHLSAAFRSLGVHSRMQAARLLRHPAGHS